MKRLLRSILLVFVIAITLVLLFVGMLIAILSKAIATTLQTLSFPFDGIWSMFLTATRSLLEGVNKSKTKVLATVGSAEARRPS